MAASPVRAVQVGDIAPRLVHPDLHGVVFDTAGDDVAGKFRAVVLCPGPPSGVIGALTAFAALHAAFRASGAGIVGVCAAKTDEPPEPLARLPFPVLLGVGEAGLGAYGVSAVHAEPATSTTVLVRPNGHILAILSGDSQASRALSIIETARDGGAPLVIVPHPPVLIVPDVLSRADCRKLISIYETSDAPMMHFTEIRGARTDVKTQVPDYDRRDRIDHMLNTGAPRKSTAGLLNRRLLPEIQKAFQYEITAFEGLRVACYEGERQGRAHGHRDNSQPEAAHRRFATSINLNSEEFSGGELRFPEYGPHRYKPETGSAIVFSSSLLHEALEVTAGKRFVLLAFLS